jgi:hypothetical protein
MGTRISHEEHPSGFERGMNFTKKHCLIRHLVHYREGKHEIEPAARIADPKSGCLRETGFDPGGKARPGNPFSQRGEHLILYVNGNDPASGPDHTGKRDGKKPHAGSDLKNGHAFPYVWRKNCNGILHEPAQRIYQEISHPPGADVMAARHGGTFSVNEHMTCYSKASVTNLIIAAAS